MCLGKYFKRNWHFNGQSFTLKPAARGIVCTGRKGSGEKKTGGGGGGKRLKQDMVGYRNRIREIELEELRECITG